MKKVTRTSAGSVSINTMGLRRVIEDLKKTRRARAHVGVLGSGVRLQSTLTNAEIGLEHEYGVITRNLPERSFLRMPLISKLPQAIAAAGAAAWRKAIVEKGVLNALGNLGALGEHVVQEAFATGGFGFWKKLSARRIREKGSSVILIDTAQLRQTIDSRVVS